MRALQYQQRESNPVTLISEGVMLSLATISFCVKHTLPLKNEAWRTDLFKIY